ncbi:monovalent cation/H+ antiporter complex subunit F [soil metagenome]|jgi:multisubunit Na+/H+ antiporter MnhF subunit|nr:Na(+)/H(+) antiporter subunit F [Gemmatimonadota bacterium]
MTITGAILETYVIWGALGVIGIGIALCAIRAFKGPSLFDRVLAFDAIALNIVGATLLLSVLFGTGAFMDFVLIVALLGFLGTISLAAYLEGSLVD